MVTMIYYHFYTITTSIHHHHHPYYYYYYCYYYYLYYYYYSPERLGTVPSMNRRGGEYHMGGGKEDRGVASSLLN